MTANAQTSLPAFGSRSGLYRRRINMFKKTRLFALLILPLALIAITEPGYAQKNVRLEIRSVSKNDAQAKKNPNGKSRLSNAANLIEVNKVKTGSFPVPANPIKRENG